MKSYLEEEIVVCGLGVDVHQPILPGARHVDAKAETLIDDLSQFLTRLLELFNQPLVLELGALQLRPHFCNRQITSLSRQSNSKTRNVGRCPT